MKSLSIVFLLISFTAFGQQKYNTSQDYGLQQKRSKIDSAFFYPTGCGAPTGLKSIVVKQSALYYDSCNAKFYLYNPKLAVWDTIKGGAAVTPSLQQVTDVGNTTTNSISITDPMYNASLSLSPSQLAFTVTGGGSTLLPSNGTTTQLTFPNAAGGFTIPIKVNNVAAGSNGNITIPTTDTTSLSNRINLRVKYTDTSSMLTAYRTAINTNAAAISTKVNISDTAAMLTPYAKSATVTSGLAAKVNISDTSSMLTDYRNAINTNSAQGTANAAAIQQRVDSLRLNGVTLEARKNSVFVPQAIRIDSIVSYAKNAGRDSTILTFQSGRRLAVKDSVGSGGGGSSNIYTADGSLTSARTLTLNSQPLTIAGTTSNRFHANGNMTFGPTDFGGVTYSDSSYKLSLVNTGLNYLRFKRAAGGADLLQFTSSSDFGTARINSGSFLHISAANSISIGGTGRVLLGTNLSDGLSPVAIGYETYRSAAASAILDIRSSTQGVLFPRMTTSQKNAIASPAEGLVVYDTTLGKLCVRTASAWETITSM